MDVIVGTFRHPTLYTLTFTPPSTLSIKSTSPATGGHSWLSLSPSKKTLYTTVWSTPPRVSAYSINTTHTLTHLNSQPVASLSGYVTANTTHLFSAGGASGEIFPLRTDGSIASCTQTLRFRDAGNENDGERAGVAHGSFGGLRHGTHSIDLSPDGAKAFVADIGHNCIWTFAVNDASEVKGKGKGEVLTLTEKKVSEREGDGPRHCFPHPNGRVLYVLQEHSCRVDCFAIEGCGLRYLDGRRIIPDQLEAGLFWADEVRFSRLGERPRWLYASTRGLERGTNGYVAVFELDGEGLIKGEAVDVWMSPTSGGLANAVEPAPWMEGQEDGVEYAALTDSEEGFVFVIKFDGRKIEEIARVRLGEEGGEVIGAATAVWL